MDNKEKGNYIEQEFIKLCNQEGIPYKHLDSWTDFCIQGESLEVKSCQLSHKFSTKTKTQSYKIGRFNFTPLQREKEIYVALFVTFNKNYLFLGIIKLGKNTPRYISIHKIREYKLYTLQEFYTRARNG